MIRRHASMALVLAAAFLGGPASAHAHGPPAKPAKIGGRHLIPERDRASYQSRVTSIDPRVPGLTVHVLRGQELLELDWRGPERLVVLGAAGEPMFRLSPRGVEFNRSSPTAWRSAERYGRVRVPDYARPGTPAEWRRLTGPGPWRWTEHRAQWMTGRRPPVVGDGASRRRIFAWTVPLRIGSRDVRVRGVLEWFPDPTAIRDERSAVSSPLLSATILLAAMAAGALAGILVRDRTRLARREPAGEIRY